VIGAAGFNSPQNPDYETNAVNHLAHLSTSDLSESVIQVMQFDQKAEDHQGAYLPDETLPPVMSTAKSRSADDYLETANGTFGLHR
jgi:hypothetical protein